MAVVFFAETRRNFEQLVEMIVDTGLNMILQEFVKTSFGRDIRVIVIGGRVVVSMERQAINGDFRTNVTSGGEGKPINIDNEMEFLSLEAIRLMELDIGGVDLLFDNNGYKNCEINSASGFKGIEKYTDSKVAEEIVKYAKYKIGCWNRNDSGNTSE